MRAGKLAHVITVQGLTTTINDMGTPTQTWTLKATLRAEKVEQSTKEYIRGYGASDETVAVFRTRFLGDITTADRIRFADQSYGIKEIAPIGRRKGLELRCVAISGVE
ncbi:head-tail adaptor protein [Cereibacter changlensis]|uniref:Head-tail adaptor protein n=1 Tax=Cereibacter changlensis TaxID=402884 RepID=A0A4U0Z012_9RHOB|nr:phage head closure protein [Cereibacter changlensis]TKA98542.1 head-tail adaptor protein [Cereibacter changlensis]